MHCAFSPVAGRWVASFVHTTGQLIHWEFLKDGTRHCARHLPYASTPRFPPVCTGVLSHVCSTTMRGHPFREYVRQETVRVVEDDAVVRRLSDVLAEVGNRVIEAPNGKAGLQLLMSDEHFELLVTMWACLNWMAARWSSV